MQAPYGFDMSDHCQTCKIRKSGFFCQMAPKAMKEFDSVRSSSAYPEGTVLFLEKQNPRGVFILCEGKIKLTISSSEGTAASAVARRSSSRTSARVRTGVMRRLGSLAPRRRVPAAPK